MKATAVLLYLLLQLIIYKPQAKGSVFVPASIAIATALVLLLWYARRRKFRPAPCFLPAALVCGLCFMAATPALRGADEELHFYRAYEVSMGHLVSDTDEQGIGGRELPSSLKEASPDNTLDFPFSKMMEKTAIPLQPERTEFIKFPTAALYAPVQYVPQGIGILLGRLLGFPPIVLVYLGRITNLLCWALLCYFAIKLSGNSPLLFVLAMMPMSVHTASTLSPDGLTNGLALLFVAYIIKLAYLERERPLTKGNVAMLFALGAGLSLCKIVYAPLCLLVLVLPKEKFGSTQGRWWAVAGLVALCGAVNVLWLSQSFGFLNEVRPGVSGIGQVKYILTHPLQYAATVLRTTAYFSNMYVHTAIGANLCLFDVPVYYWISDVFLLLLLYTAVHQNVITPLRRDRWTALSVMALVFLLINSALYVQWTVMGAGLIDGIQGRYFLPLLPLLLLVFPRRSERDVSALVVTSTVLLLYPVMLTLLIKHIG